jgi:outer membrane protein OmpA-like peptidoglycan-associated protein
MFGSLAPRFDRTMRALSLATVLVVAGSVSAAPAKAQGMIDRVKQKVKDKTDAVTDSIADAKIDKATGAVMCAASNSACIKKATDSGKQVEIVDAKGKPVSAADSAKAMDKAGVQASGASSNSDASAASATPSQGFGDVLVNYDFVPGDRVIFAEDFARDPIGDFPKRLELRHGNFEVAKWQGQQYLRTNSGGNVALPLPEVLPSRFTFEADYKGSNGWSLEINFADPDKVDNLVLASFGMDNGSLGGGVNSVNSSSEVPEGAVKPIVHVAVMADGKYVKTYVNGVRVTNVPNADLGRGKVVVLGVPGNNDEPGYISNIRIAAGGKPLYEAIMADGRVATHGILFDTGSDRIRAESKPTLDMIGQMLNQHADLKLTIEGHTDNVGSAASNQTLSDKRAAAVRQFLISTYHIDGGRLTSKGLGATKPAVTNDTPEGRQQNRRVELVKAP